MLRTGTVERAYIDTISLLDRAVVARYVAVVALLFASLLLTAHWAGSPRSALDAFAAPMAVEETVPGVGLGSERVSGTAR